MEQWILKQKPKGNYKAKIIVMIPNNRSLYKAKYADYTVKELKQAIADIQDCGAEAMANNDNTEIAHQFQAQEVVMEMLSKRLKG